MNYNVYRTSYKYGQWKTEPIGDGYPNADDAIAALKDFQETLEKPKELHIGEDSEFKKERHWI